ncbi:MAG: AAA family ATPase, partial [Myxococcota bacterium]
MSDTCNLIVNPLGKMPVGISNFAQVVQGDYCFVDKSVFIKEILDSGDGVTLITRPRRFGKTINMNMLRCFLQQPAPPVILSAQHEESHRATAHGEVLPRYARQDDKKEDLFANLAISHAGEIYQRERGKRPVIFVSLRTVKELEWEPAFRRMSALLSDLAQEASQEAPVNSLTSSQQDILRKVIRKQ